MSVPTAHPAVTAAELASCHRIRRAVVIDELGVPESEEIDGLDSGCTHFLAWVAPTGESRDPERAVGTARLMITEDGQAKAQRVAVMAAERGTGVGAALMKAVESAAQSGGYAELTLGAQKAAIPFYERIGYVAYGAEFMDAGIPHRMMRCSLEVPLRVR
jgi:predicted GNAT family N-acyltransferase